jgi:hypothetical protein
VTIAGKCRCGSTRPTDDASWITVRLMSASGQPSPSAWSLCGWPCVLELARTKTADAVEAVAV